MPSGEYRALVVDDEPALRMLTIRELTRSGFTCDGASDGRHAKELVAANRYDLVLTDLCMPTVNGHALAVDLLGLPDRPVVVVLTGVTEPRIAKDLIARGIDDIIFKPVDQSVLAAKVRAMIEHRHARPAGVITDGTAATKSGEPSALPRQSEPFVVTSADLDAKLAQLASVLPISHAALDVVKMTNVETVATSQLVAAIELDPSLSAELLRVANSGFYNQSGQNVAEVKSAVVRLGRRRTGEVALAMSTMGALTSRVLPWMDVGLTWRRSVAAGLALELLIAQTGQSQMENGLFLGAAMHSLGRIVLGTLYPVHYQLMVAQCERRGTTLQDLERRYFQRSHTSVMAQILKAWKIPEAIFKPLRYSLDPPAVVADLSEPLRTKVELISLAVLIGQIAAREWETWDAIEIPLVGDFHRLKIKSLAHLVAATRADLQSINQQKYLSSTGSLHARDAKSSDRPKYELTYCKISDEPFDFLAEILLSMNIDMKCCNPAEISIEQPVVINCLGIPAARLSGVLPSDSRNVLVTDDANPLPYQQFGKAVALPQSYSVLRSAVLQAARTNT